MVEPADSSEAKEFTKLAYELSEKFDTPFIVRMTTRISHSQSVVELCDREERPLKEYVKDAAKYVTENQIMGGEQPYVFGGSKALTRAQVASALYNLAGQPDVELASFDDVPVTHQARAAIAWAAQTGIMQGVGNNKFAPEATITRAEIATLLTRQLKLSGTDVSADPSEISTFADSGKISSWAADGVAYCTKTGLVQCKPGNLFAPTDLTSRAELAAILMRIAA